MKPIEYLVTAEEMQHYDANTQEAFKIPGLVLMEQAAMACRDIILDRFPGRKKVLILAGKGNNGGDGLALARLLHQKHYDITVCIVSNHPESLDGYSPSCKTQYEILKSMGISIVTNLRDTSYDIIVDAIFGVGLSRNIEGNVADMLETVNQLLGFKISIDMPSGVDATTGRVCGIAFRADLTITFAFLKRGLFLLPGARYAGEVVIGEIGITNKSFLGKEPSMFALKGNIHDYLPKRDSYGHKGTFGKILIVAGSKTVGGAAILAAKAAFASGCGMVRVCTHKANRSDFLTILPEAMIDDYEDEITAAEQVRKGLPWADVIAIGPGMGTDTTAKALLKTVLLESRKPLVIDADGLNLSAEDEMYSMIRELQNTKETKRDLILTPHPLELARICHCKIEDITNHGLQSAVDLAEELKAIVIKKDANTMITDGKQQAVNLCGNSGMATAGSGDVLCGITAALLALNLPVFETAVISVYLHALAGDKAAETKNEYSVIASDIIAGIWGILSQEYSS